MHTGSILMAGSGTSRMSEQMYAEGYTCITNIDASRVANEAMNARLVYVGVPDEEGDPGAVEEERQPSRRKKKLPTGPPELVPHAAALCARGDCACRQGNPNDCPNVYKTMQCEKMDFDDNQFDAVVAKATLDAILSGARSKERSYQFLLECYRVMKPTGVLFILSRCEPAVRLPLLEDETAEYEWGVNVFPVAKPRIAGRERATEGQFYFLYACVKGQKRGSTPRVD